MKIYESKFDPTLKLVWFDGIEDRPNLISYLAMRQDYSPDPIYLKYDKIAKQTEQELGEKVYRLAIKFNHFGVIEHSGGLLFNVAGFPHDTPMQHRTHRVGVSFDVMSQRYTGKHFLKVWQNENFFSEDFIRQYFYFPPIGTVLTNREGKQITYTIEHQLKHISLVNMMLIRYCEDLESGFPEEVARRQLPQGIRQHYVFSCNQRSLLHVLDVRSPSDVQSEFRLLSELFMEFYEEFNPVLAIFYKEKRYKKNKLAP